MVGVGDGDCWAVARAFCALVSPSCAEATAVCWSELSMRASTWPALTVSPARTSSSVTVPATLKLRPRVADAWTVPAADAVTATVPRRTVDTVLATVCGVALCTPDMASTLTTASTATTTPAAIPHASRE